MSTTSIDITVPPHFNFRRTARSHGWYALPPFSITPDSDELSRTLLLADGTVVHATMRENGKGIRVTMQSDRSLRVAQKNEVRRQLATCLRLDEDFSDFHAQARRYPEFRWIAASGSGRMLCSPTVFEDTMKMICTTNCTWALTTLMVTNLVQAFGKRSGDALAFPTPEAIAGSSENFLRAEIKAGYRSPYIIELARKVAEGKVNLEDWRNSPLSTDELFTQMRTVKGIGPYAAGNIMKLIGRYDYLGLDSWVRAKYYELHRNGRTVKDSTIERHYKHLGKWRGLFFWMEMTRYWHDDKFQAVKRDG